MTPDSATWFSDVREWRKAQDSFYAAAMSDAELYMTAVRLVRAIVDSLADITDFEMLLQRYRQSDASDVYSIAESLDEPRMIFLDYDLALGTAFFLRAQEIREEETTAEMQAQIAAARLSNQTWAVLLNEEANRKGIRFFERLEMNLHSGVGLRLAAELDFEKGRVFVLEPLMLDVSTGEARRDIKLDKKKQEFETEAELNEAAEALRRYYAAHEEKYGTAE